MDEKNNATYDGRTAWQHVQQLRRDAATMHMKDIDIAEQNLAAAYEMLVAKSTDRDDCGLASDRRYDSHAKNSALAAQCAIGRSTA